MSYNLNALYAMYKIPQVPLPPRGDKTTFQIPYVTPLTKQPPQKKDSDSPPNSPGTHRNQSNDGLIESTRPSGESPLIKLNPDTSLKPISEILIIQPNGSPKRTEIKLDKDNRDDFKKNLNQLTEQEEFFHELNKSFIEHMQKLIKFNQGFEGEKDSHNLNISLNKIENDINALPNKRIVDSAYILNNINNSISKINSELNLSCRHSQYPVSPKDPKTQRPKDKRRISKLFG